MVIGIIKLKVLKGELDILTSIFESEFYKENSILTNSYLKAQDVIIVRNE